VDEAVAADLVRQVDDGRPLRAVAEAVQARSSRPSSVIRSVAQEVYAVCSRLRSRTRSVKRAIVR